MNSIVPVILSGGSGSRLWPISRSMYPKQLLPLVSDRTMLQETALRVAPDDLLSAPLIVCNEEHRFIVAEQLRAIDVEPVAILLEEEGRNTAPAAVLAALRVMEEDKDAFILLLPSDHVIGKPEVFRQAIALGARAAAKGQFVTFGITPNAPETGYGYIRRCANCDDLEGVYAVEAFYEKPDVARATAYLESGDYYWNSGMFLMPAALLLEEAKTLIPDVVKACEAAMKGRASDLDFERPAAEAFASSPAISIDYGIMEKTDRTVILPVDMGWSDVGAWSALWDLGTKDDEGNSVRGDALLVGVQDSLIRADGASVAAVNVDNLIIVTTKDMVLVADRNQAQDVKKIVEKLGQEGRSEQHHQTITHRPWGSFESVDVGKGYQVKRLTVKPGAILSLQKHAHRSEHWVVVQGTAGVVCGERELTLQANESVYIPVGTIHRLENPGDKLLHVIEVQTGDYLGEDDIERFEDVYGRKEQK